MHAPRTKTLLIVAVVLFALAAISIPTFYPAPVPVLGPDGAPVLNPDGSPVVHRDMTQYYRYTAPAFTMIAGSLCVFVWWLTRMLRLFYGRRTS
jgi:hypothetical protein